MHDAIQAHTCIKKANIEEMWLNNRISFLNLNARLVG